MKSAHQILTEALPKLGDVRQGFVDARDALIELRDEAPERAAVLDPKIASLNEKIAALDEAVESADLAHAATTIVTELSAIFRVGLTGTSHPHTATGG